MWTMGEDIDEEKTAPHANEIQPAEGVARVRPARQVNRRRYPPEIESVLMSYMAAHEHDPYPSIEEKTKMARQTGLSLRHVNNWLVNYRVRKLKYNKHSRRNKLASELKQSMLSARESNLDPT